MLAVKRFTPEEEQKIRAAIRQAEGGGSGRIGYHVADRSDAHVHVDFVGALIGQFACLLGGIWLLPAGRPSLLIGVQSLGLIVGFLAFRHAGVLKRLLLAPKVAGERVFERAFRAFHDLQLGRRADRTGVLIFVSLLERRVLVLADSGINALVRPGVWQQVADLVLEGIRRGDPCQGLCDAVDRCGRVIAEALPNEDRP